MDGFEPGPSIVSRLSSTKCSFPKARSHACLSPCSFPPTKNGNARPCGQTTLEMEYSFPLFPIQSSSRSRWPDELHEYRRQTHSGHICDDPARRVSTGQSTTHQTSKARYVPVMLADKETIPKTDPLFSMNTPDKPLQSQPTKEFRGSCAQDDVRHLRGNRHTV